MVDERAQQALGHLQAAALELIEALRAVLDVAEEAVREPQAVVDVLTASARAAAHIAGASGMPTAAWPNAARSDAAGSTADDADGARSPGCDRSPGVQHIPIS